jgi:heme-degrading monooxygenase HmoA
MLAVIFEVMPRPGVVLSLSWWRDEAAITAWRGTACHRAGQAEGRETVFADYRIRVMSCVRDYGMRDRTQAPADSNVTLL